MNTRVIGYVDGFNLYFGLRSQGLQSGYWLDVAELLRRLMPLGSQLVQTKYFTSRISGPPDKAKRQTNYLDALAGTPGINLYFGKYQDSLQKCASCASTWTVHNEKMTDVNIATELLTDCIEDRFDVAMVVSGDSDLVPPVRAIRRLWPTKRIMAVFPPGRGSIDLRTECHGHRRIRSPLVMSCQLPPTVFGPDGHPKTRPNEWN
jgi:uncharacterized LabA/DUF88 family protein